ncbi:MAG: DivIVA domain-containing protein, partial [Acidimicrobiaceae bacterium]|nr:DivIVA domain-containing protein [Acidimicrobiaceae bacterium]
MDVTPKTLREVVFREKLRGGYHPDDVDEFLEQVASGVEDLHNRLRQALDRAQRAEAGGPSAPESANGGADEAVRTLVLAQRTADMTVQEAREQASKILANAETQAQTVVSAAEERARRHEDTTLASTRGELTKLEAVRSQAQREVEALNRWMEEHKAHLKSTLRDALSVVDRSGTMSPPPTSHPIESVHREPPAAPAADPSRSDAKAGDDQADGAPETGETPAVHGPTAAPWKTDPDATKFDTPVAGDGAQPRDRQPAQMTVNAEQVSHEGASGVGSPAAGSGDHNDPDEQALDEFFDDPEFAADDDRRFGG